MTTEETRNENPTTESAETGEAGGVWAYEKLAAQTRAVLAESKERSAVVLGSAIDQAAIAVVAAGEVTADQVERAANYLRRDLADIGRNAERARELVLGARRKDVKGGFLSLASDVLETAGDALKSLGEKLEQPAAFNTGEVTSPGTLTCRACENELHFKETGRIPPCGKCHGTAFRKTL